MQERPLVQKGPSDRLKDLSQTGLETNHWILENSGKNNDLAWRIICSFQDKWK